VEKRSAGATASQASGFGGHAAVAGRIAVMRIAGAPDAMRGRTLPRCAGRLAARGTARAGAEPAGGTNPDQGAAPRLDRGRRGLRCGGIAARPAKAW
jgi:hypothetical protein